MIRTHVYCRPVAYGSSPGYEAASATPCIQPPPPLHSSSAGSARRSGSARVSEEAAFQSRLCYSVVSELLMYGVTLREIIHMEGYPGSFPPSSTLPQPSQIFLLKMSYIPVTETGVYCIRRVGSLASYWLQ
jgi:hypothetical protein